MESGTRSHIEVDWKSFDPWRITPVRHDLTSHFLLQPAQLTELGRRLESRNLIRTHSNAATAGTPFNDAPSLAPNRKSAKDTLSQIRDAKAWMSLLNVQVDDIYRTLVDEVLDQLRPEIEKRDPGMCYRAGWIFVTSPHTVTPFHIDKEHNFILQIHGCKRLYVWDHRDTEVVSELARDRFHHRHARDLIKWRDDFKSRAQVFHLEPGVGAYMPSTSPHMVENDDDPSITMSFTYYTDATRRNSRVHAMHEVMRQRGLSVGPVGSSPLLDNVLYTVDRTCRAVPGLKLLYGSKAPRPDGVRYAHAEVG
jgi:oxalate decarboxylase/phosphoglucose isomerase-like protein (cupin superfamily)